MAPTAFTNDFSDNDTLSVRGAHLHLESCDLVELAEQFGTPCFVLSTQRIRENFHRLQGAFAKRWPEGETLIFPAFKAAPYLAVRQLLSECGAGCDTFGPSELEGAIRGGTDPSLISVNGSLKERATIRRGIEIGALIVIDAPREIEICEEEAAAVGRPARLLFRIKPPMRDLDLKSDFADQSISDLTQRVRYGMPENEVLPLGPQVARSPNLDLEGFHAHVGRHSTDQRLWAALARSTVDSIAGLIRAWGWSDWAPKIIDLGGGYAPPSNFDSDHARTGEPAPPIEEYAETMTSALRQAFAAHGMSAEGVRLMVEPGRALHSDTGLHLTRVENVKQDTGETPRIWVELDTSEQFLGTWALDPTTPHFRIAVANKASADADQTVDVVGKSCGAEMLALDLDIPKLAPGDLVALRDTGAYIESLACNFNAMPRPGTVLVDGDRAIWIRVPETIEDVYARDRAADVDPSPTSSTSCTSSART